ncbi:MAG: peptidyl-prolyl cis-trans isomerase [Acidobacteria bacterium]|jgi:peptidyl-prolyl cis-trans isomerase D|nr:peptidyl-prolyl cis-trans isomerase [Acidobacteriota bacterium]
MTMLDRMRRHKAWLKWSLALVVVTFILLYVPSFMDPLAGTGANPNDAVATVDGRRITVGTFQRMYQQQMMSVQQAYGGQLTNDMIAQLGIPQRVIQQMIDEEAMIAEAERLGLVVTDVELKERIVRMPGFQQDGQFIGEDRYRQVLQMQRPPLSAKDFEASLRKSLLAEKLQAAITGWVTLPEGDVEQEYRQRNEKVKLEMAVLMADNFRAGITPTDAEISAHFAANQETYRTPEKRRVRFINIDPETLRATMTVTPAEVDARYRENMSTFSTPEQVRASHILFKTEGKDEATVEKAAQAVLARVGAGEDFAALAKQFSEDSSAANGGDLDFSAREGWVKEFSDAAFGQDVGEVSGLVKSQFGFHIIKTTDKRAPATRTLAEVRPQLEDQIKFEKAQTEAQKIATDAAGQIDDPSDLDRVAQSKGLTVGDSGLFSRDEPLAGLGFAPAVAAEAFTMEQGKVSGQLRTNQGFAFISLVEIAPPALPALDAVKDRVRDDVARLQAIEVAKTRAATLSQAAQRGSFAAAAKAAGVEMKTTELITRGFALPDVGVNSAVDDAVFALQQGQVTSPISTPNAVVVAKVVERATTTPEAFAAEKTALTNELLQRRRQEFFASYMTKAKTKMTITFNDEALKVLLGR